MINCNYAIDVVLFWCTNKGIDYFWFVANFLFAFVK